MVKRLLLAIAALIALSNPVLGEPIFISVQSSAIKPYEEVLQGFKSTWHGKSKSYVLSEHLLFDLTGNIKKKAPDIVLAIGLDALETIKHLADIPIIYTMVLCSDAEALNRNNIYGVCMRLPTKTQLQTMLKVLPDFKRIGILYDPHESEKTVKEALGLAPQLGVNLIAKAVQAPREISSVLTQMKGQVEVIWMLPDLTLKYPMAMELFLLFSIENKVPLVSYSEKYMEMGVFMSIGINAFDMGCQAGDIANRILSEGDAVKNEPMEAISPIISINKTIAEKFGIDLGKAKAMSNVREWHR